MNTDDKSKLKAYEELIGSLEHTNELQHKVIETQSSLIKSLEEHNADYCFIILFSNSAKPAKSPIIL